MNRVMNLISAAAKGKPKRFLRELFVAVFSDEDRYGHISESDGDADET